MEINDIRSNPFQFFLTIPKISDRAKQNTSSKTSELRVFSWTCSCYPRNKSRSAIGSPGFFWSAAQVRTHKGIEENSGINCFHWLSLVPYTFRVTPDTEKDMWSIFPTNRSQGLLLSWVIRHVPALFCCFCCRVRMVVQHFPIPFQFQKKNDGEERKRE